MGFIINGENGIYEFFFLELRLRLFLRPDGDGVPLDNPGVFAL